MVRSPINKDARAISGIMLEMNYIAALDKRPETQAYGSRVTRRSTKVTQSPLESWKFQTFNGIYSDLLELWSIALALLQR